MVRYAMLTIAQQLAQYLLVLRQPQGRVNLTTVYVNETLMDVAARALGDFEAWSQIAALNGLVPPYVGPVSQPGIVGWGQQVVLPTPGASGAALGPLPSYNANFLGTDLYLGPIIGSMPNWTGDFETVTGYSNLSYALGRRLQTPLGSLIYHPTYGCRIPSQIGVVQDNATLGQIAAFGKSALLSDPRVQTVLSAVATLVANSTVAFSGTVQPGGFTNTAVGVDEVISPLP